MMAATPTKLSSEADVGRSKAQHVVILAFCSKIAGITYSASPNTALDPRLGAKTGLNDEVFVNKLTASVPNGKCQVILLDRSSWICFTTIGATGFSSSSVTSGSVEGETRSEAP